MPLRRWLEGHTVVTTYEKGWDTLNNGDLIRYAENDGFDVFVTTDKNLKYQQNLSDRKISIGVLLSINWPKMEARALDVAAFIDVIQPGAYLEIPV